MLSKSVSLPRSPIYGNKRKHFTRAEDTELFFIRWMPGELWETVESVESGEEAGPQPTWPCCLMVPQMSVQPQQMGPGLFV